MHNQHERGMLNLLRSDRYNSRLFFTIAFMAILFTITPQLANDWALITR